MTKQQAKTELASAINEFAELIPERRYQDKMASAFQTADVSPFRQDARALNVKWDAALVKVQDAVDAGINAGRRAQDIKRQLTSVDNWVAIQEMVRTIHDYAAFQEILR